MSFVSTLPRRVRSRVRHLLVLTDIHVRVPLRFILHVVNWWQFFRAPGRDAADVTYRMRSGLRFSVPAHTTDINPFTDIWFRRVYDAHGVDFDHAKTVIDVGAHVGAFVLYAAHRSRDARIYAFEPEPESFAFLRKNVEQNGLQDRVRCFQAGIGGEQGHAELHVLPGRGEGNSMYRAVDGSNAVRISTMRLQDLFDREGIARCDILKMNAEGVEYEIFYGLPAQYFDRISAIVMNYHVFVPHPDATPEKLRAHLERHGFTVREQGKRIFVAVKRR